MMMMMMTGLKEENDYDDDGWSYSQSLSWLSGQNNQHILLPDSTLTSSLQLGEAILHNPTCALLRYYESCEQHVCKMVSNVKAYLQAHLRKEAVLLTVSFIFLSPPFKIKYNLLQESYHHICHLTVPL